MDGGDDGWLVGGGFGSAVHFVGDGGGFEGQGAEGEPVVDGQFFGEAALGGGRGEEFGEDGVEKSDELRARFAVDEDGVGQVFKIRGIFANGWMLWTGGFRRISPVGGLFFF